MGARTAILFGVLLDCDSAPCRFVLQSVELGVTARNAEPPSPVFRMNPYLVTRQGLPPCNVMLKHCLLEHREPFIVFFALLVIHQDFRDIHQALLREEFVEGSLRGRHWWEVE